MTDHFTSHKVASHPLCPTISVLITINTSWNIYNFRSALIHALTQKGITVYTAAPEDDYSARVASLVTRHFSIPMDNAGLSPWRDAMLFIRYLRLLSHLQPTVVLAYTIKPNIYATLAAKILGIPVIANVSGLGTAFLHGHWVMRAVQQFYGVALRKATRVFFQNPDDMEIFTGRRLVHPENAQLLPGSGVNLDYFHPKFNHARSEETIRFVLIARLLLDKGIGEYVAAARRVKQQFPNVTFNLLGPKGIANRSAVSDQQLEQWQSEGIIHYLGETDDVRSMMACHDCIVLPSYREGMSHVLLEAAAMGKPLIASNVAGCKQIVHHGANGLLCQPRNEVDLADRLIDFIQLTPQQREQMGKESRAIAEAEFDEQKVIAQYLSTIELISAAS